MVTTFQQNIQPCFSLAADLDMELLMFSFSSCGPLRLGSGVCGVEVC